MVGGLDELHGVNFFYKCYFLCAKSCGLNVAIFGSIFLLFGWFRFLIVDGWFPLGIVLIFLALCFSVLLW